MARLSLLDLAFFIAETPASPKHVAGLHIHQRPKFSKPGAGKGFARALFDEWLTHDQVKPPFNRVIQFFAGDSLWPSWRAVSHVNLRQHLHFHTLKAPANDRAALYEKVAALHEPMLDRRRPLWDVHVIDGLWDGQFAVYYRMHHAYADGITMARWGAESLASEADDLQLRPVWAADRGRRGGCHAHAAPRSAPDEHDLEAAHRQLQARGGRRAARRHAAAGGHEADQERHRPALHGEQGDALSPAPPRRAASWPPRRCRWRASSASGRPRAPRSTMWR
jgi:hypothetical protein